MCVHINTLPDDDLLLIFYRVPLFKLLQLDRVCHRWARLLSSACARRCTLVLILCEDRLDEMHYFLIPFNTNLTKIAFNGWRLFYNLPALEVDSALKFSIGVKANSFDEFLSYDDDGDAGFFDILYQSTDDGPADYTEMDRFRDARLSGQLVSYFMDLFPNVENLVMIHDECREKELRLMIDLLAPSWSLRTLKLWIRTWGINETYEDRPEHHPVRTLLHSINRQSSLQQLTLDIDCEGLDFVTFPEESYSFIAQLKVLKLFLGSYDSDNLIWNTIHRFDSPKLYQICLGNCDNFSMEMALKPTFKYTSKVHQLLGYLNFETFDKFSEFCYRFSSLTTLQMKWKQNITFTRLVSNLALLTKLTHLKLELSIKEYPENPFALMDGDDEEESRGRICLPQVKILELGFFNRTLYDFGSLSPLVFPSVEVIILEDYQCHICRLDPNTNNDPERVSRCHVRLIRSLKNIFSNSSVRLYATRLGALSFVDYTNHVFTEEDDQPAEIGAGHDDDDQSKE